MWFKPKQNTGKLALSSSIFDRITEAERGLNPHIDPHIDLDRGPDIVRVRERKIWREGVKGMGAKSITIKLELLEN